MGGALTFAHERGRRRRHSAARWRAGMRGRGDLSLRVKPRGLRHAALQDLAAVRHLRRSSGARRGTRSPTSSATSRPSSASPCASRWPARPCSRFAAGAASALALSRRPITRALALQGVFLYGVSYVCVYHAERFVASGLVAVGYSASPLLAGRRRGAAVRRAARPRASSPAACSAWRGVALIFWPEIARPARAAMRAALGAALHRASVLLSAVGSLAASRNRQRGVAAAAGDGLRHALRRARRRARRAARSAAASPGRRAPSWWLSLAYLAFAGSVLTFACFLTLQDRRRPRARPAPSA